MNYFSRKKEELNRRKRDLIKIFQNKSKVWFIHYACEAYDKRGISAPRISSICLLNFETKDLISFSIHLTGNDSRANLKNISKSKLDELEQKMLTDFASFVKKNANCIWVHWNMIDARFGFDAILRRSTILGSKKKINNSNLDKINLLDVLELVYSDKIINRNESEVIKKGRLIYLANKNGIDTTNIIEGKEEANLYDLRDFSKIYLSVSAKVKAMEKIITKVHNNSLSTDIRFSNLRFLNHLNQKYLAWALAALLSGITLVKELVITAYEPQIQEKFGMPKTDLKIDTSKIINKPNKILSIY